MTDSEATRLRRKGHMARQLDIAKFVGRWIVPRARPRHPGRRSARWELEASLDETLAARPTDAPVWLFGYGSPMWNPAFPSPNAVSNASGMYDGSVCGCAFDATERRYR
jgi:hypothetical protein